MSDNLHGTFVSEKISKIRWRPDQFENSHKFITGSWDNDQNTIKLWNCGTNEEDIYPYELKSYDTDGDVTEIQFINQDLLVASTSDGSVTLLRITDRQDEVVDLQEKVKWQQVHKFKNDTCSCTALSIYDEDIATVGEDGSLNLMTSRREALVRTIENADSCSLQCVTFLKFNEVLTGNIRGQMKIWDLRNAEDKPTNTFMLNGDHIAATCLTYHPTQRHMILAGDEEGSIVVWDLRQNTYPVTLLNAHAGAVSEIQFSSNNPDHLFSCSMNGNLWHWRTVADIKACALMPVHTEPINPWITTNENIRNKLEVFALMPALHKPINSLDLDRNKLLCGCDNEAVYLINNINLA